MEYVFCIAERKHSCSNIEAPRSVYSGGAGKSFGTFKRVAVLAL